MPRGYPDYFGQSIFPQYGQAYSIVLSGTLNAYPHSTVLFDITGKGLILGGNVIFYNVYAGGNLWLNLTIDNEIVYNNTIDNLFNWKLDTYSDYPIKIAQYGVLVNPYIVHLKSGVTFSFAYKLVASWTGTGTPPKGGVLAYSLVRY